MAQCTEVPDCAAKAVVNYTVDCGECKDVASTHAAIAADATSRADVLASVVAEAEDELEKATLLTDVIAKLEGAFAAVAKRDAASRDLAGARDEATSATITARAHAEPHNHPVYACEEHAPPEWHEAVWNSTVGE